MSPGPSGRPFQSVLCPVDFSTHSRAALQHAVAIVRRTAGHLTVLYVQDPWLGSAIAAGYDSRLLNKRTLMELRQLLTRVGVPPDSTPALSSAEVVAGRPAAEILKVARRRESDLIVMGTQGLSGASKMFFGSTTEHVLRQATRAVLAVPHTPKIPKGWPGNRVVGAIELSGSDRQDSRAIAEVARAFGAKLTLVHVVRPTAAPPWLAPQLRTQDRERLAAAKARLRRLAADVAGSDVESRVVLGDPGEELPALAEDVGADLMVIRLRRGHGVFGRRQGSTTYRVLCGSAIPVLALSPGR